MFWKLLTLAILLGFAWWRWRQFLRERRLRAQGEPLPEKKGMRPISILALGLLLMYGGYLLWVILVQTYGTLQNLG